MKAVPPTDTGILEGARMARTRDLAAGFRTCDQGPDGPWFHASATDRPGESVRR